MGPLVNIVTAERITIDEHGEKVKHTPNFLNCVSAYYFI